MSKHVAIIVGSLREGSYNRKLAQALVGLPPDGLEFTYIWQQEHFNPVDNGLRCSIHFAFSDGSRIERAFHYDWRLWTLPEIRELLLECGFSRVTTYWQGFDDEGESDGEFKPVTVADADAGWICYLAAEK